MSGSVQEIKSLLSDRGFSFKDIIFSSERSCVLLVSNSQGQSSVLKIRKGSSHALQKEAKILTKIQHPNVVLMKNYFTTPKFTVLELEKVEGTCLIDIVSSNGAFQEDQVKEIARQLIDSLIYLNEKKMAHLDLKPDNVMYDISSGTIKLIDLETVNPWSKWKKQKELVGTDVYRSPEVLNRSYRGPEAQNWSLGVTLYALLTGDLPKWEESLSRSESSLSNKKHNPELVFPPNISRIAQDFIKKLLCFDSKKRGTLPFLKEHPWLGVGLSKSTPNF